MTDMTTKDVARELAPFLALTALVAFMATVLFVRFAMPVGGVGSSAAPAVATFDVIRYANAQRAVASAFLKRDADQVSANELLTGLSERTRKTISEVAGPNTLVVLKQSVIQGPSKDITDEVLKQLGLPTNVPTSDAVAYTLDVAPTMMLRPPAGRNPAKLPGEDSAGAGVLP